VSRRRGLQRGTGVPAPVAVVASLVAAAALLPPVYLVIRATDDGSGTLFAGTPEAWEVIRSDRSLELLRHTVLLALACTASCVAIGVPLAWLTARTDLPGRTALFVAACLPLTIPTFVGGYTFVSAFRPRGIVQGWLQPLGVDELPDPYGFRGAWIVITLFSYPYVLLTVRAALLGLDPSLEEASRTLGMSRLTTFRRVVLPQLLPAISAGALLVTLYTIAEFGAVSTLRYDTFTRAIFVQYQNSFDRTRAASLALVLVALTGLVLLAEGRLRSRASYHRLGAGAARVATPVPLGRWKWPAVAAVLALVGLALVGPLYVIAYWILDSSGGPATEGVGRMLWNSVKVSGLGAVAATVAAGPIAYVAVRSKGRLGRVVERASYACYALPGLVVALSLVFFGSRYVPDLYQTTTMLVFGYVVLFLPQAVGAIRASLLQLDPGLEEASRTLGHRWTATLRRVVFPLVRPGALAGASLVFLTAMKELPATLLLAPNDFQSLATSTYLDVNESFFADAAVTEIALVGVSSVPLALLIAWEARAGRARSRLI
jgi:iron(III) transport system permease protein